MPWCEACTKFYPANLLPRVEAYAHANNCRRRKELLGMPKYVWEGTDMYEVDEVTGVRRLANSTTEPVHGPNPPPIPKTAAQLWLERREEEKKTEKPGYPGMYGDHYSRPYSGQPGSSYQYKTYTPPPPPVKPWDGVDRKRWPRLWGFLLKFYFAPTYGKETRWVDVKKPAPDQEVTAELEVINPYQWEGSM